MINFKTHRNVHFIGIGGVSMSGLAEILLSKNCIVSGSDMKESLLTEHLSSIGINVTIGQKAENIKDDCNLVVYTAAINENNPELLMAKAKGIMTIDRAYLLGEIMSFYKYSIGVAGTHGKTSTTSMVSQVLINAEKDPTISVGGILSIINSNFKLGNSEYFVAESCEYFDSFLKFYPYIGIILNVDKDHTDYFKSMEQLESSFNKFACNISKDGALIINKSIKNLDNILKNVTANIITFGFSDADYTAENIVFSKFGKPSFDVYYKNQLLTNLNLNVAGLHNIENTLAAFASCHYLNINIDDIKNALNEFEGAKRRFEIKGSFNDISVIDDYAHHPTEIAATLSAAKMFSHNKIYCVFQPHTYSRTKSLLDRFAGSFVDADVVVMLDIYPARETDTLGIHSMDLVKEIKKTGKEVYYFDNFKDAEDFLLKETIPNDMLITMGAGDVYLLGEDILLTALSTLSTEISK